MNPENRNQHWRAVAARHGVRLDMDTPLNGKVFSVTGTTADELFWHRVMDALSLFMKIMRGRIISDAHKGDWSECLETDLIKRLREEIDELEATMSDPDVNGIVSKCADVAIFAMFIADNRIRLAQLEAPFSGCDKRDEKYV